MDQDAISYIIQGLILAEVNNATNYLDYELRNYAGLAMSISATSVSISDYNCNATLCTVDLIVPDEYTGA